MIPFWWLSWRLVWMWWASFFQILSRSGVMDVVSNLGCFKQNHAAVMQQACIEAPWNSDQSVSDSGPKVSRPKESTRIWKGTRRTKTNRDPLVSLEGHVKTDEWRKKKPLVETLQWGRNTTKTLGGNTWRKDKKQKEGFRFWKRVSAGTTCNLDRTVDAGHGCALTATSEKIESWENHICGVTVAACLQLVSAATLLMFFFVLGQALCAGEKESSQFKSCSFHMFSWHHQANIRPLSFCTSGFSHCSWKSKGGSRNNPPLNSLKKQFSRVFHPKTVGSSKPKKNAFFTIPENGLSSKDEMDLDCQQHFCDRRLMVRIVSWPKRPLRLMDMGKNWLDTENAPMPKEKRVDWCLSILFFEPWPYLWAMAKDLVCKSFVDLRSPARYASKWFLYGTLAAFAVQVVGPTQPRRTGMFSTFQTLCTSSQSFTTKQNCIWKRCGQGTE